MHEDATELTPVVRVDSGPYRAFDQPRLLPVVRLADQDATTAPTAPTALPPPTPAVATEPTRLPRRRRPPPRAPSTLPRPATPARTVSVEVPPTAPSAQPTRAVAPVDQWELPELPARDRARNASGLQVLQVSPWLKVGVLLAAGAWLTLIAAWLWAAARG